MEVIWGYEFNDFFSSEIGYTDLGDAQARIVASAPTAAVINADTEASAFTASIVGIYLLNDELGVFGRLGVAYWRVDGTAVVAVGGTTVTASAESRSGCGSSGNITVESATRALALTAAPTCLEGVSCTDSRFLYLSQLADRIGPPVDFREPHK